LTLRQHLRLARSGLSSAQLRSKRFEIATAYRQFADRGAALRDSRSGMRVNDSPLMDEQMGERINSADQAIRQRGKSFHFQMQPV
jgi:hypothetical protein